ncbi:MAG TPA: efflux RND transporter periplasmic adaptor subunit [Planctomycetota bacterium]|nr:efflux RND transporter periplasmic adaptor subunit [Planctomycetota bacterium]
MVSSATLVSTIAVNLNPLLRFDGYYLLSDLWNLDNLRSRSTAVARWSIRLWLLGLKNDSPEPIFARSRLLGMTAYALFGWLYRLGVYAALALLAFHALFKVAGIALLMLIAVNLIARPIALEARELWKLRRQWWGTRRSVVTVSVAALAFAWVAAPLPRAVAAPAILVPVTEQTFFVPFDGIVSEMSAARGRIVRKGEKLLTIRSPELEAQWAALKGEAAALAALLDSTRHDPARRSSVKEAEEKLAKTRQEMALVADRLDRSVVRSTVAGTITEWIDSRIEGQSIAEGWYLGRIANVAEWRLVGYVEERDREAISPGTQIKFYAAEAGVSWEGRIRAIAPAQTQIIFHPGLTSTAGGPIEVVGRTPLKAYFEVDVGLDVREGRIPKGYSGSMRFRTPPQSLLVRGLALLWIALIRESGF